jgi:hypothetical protein
VLTAEIVLLNLNFPKDVGLGRSGICFMHGEVSPYFKGYFGSQVTVISPSAFYLPAKLLPRYSITDMNLLRFLFI